MSPHFSVVLIDERLRAEHTLVGYETRDEAAAHVRRYIAHTLNPHNWVHVYHGAWWNERMQTRICIRPLD